MFFAPWKNDYKGLVKEFKVKGVGNFIRRTIVYFRIG